MLGWGGLSFEKIINSYSIWFSSMLVWPLLAANTVLSWQVVYCKACNLDLDEW